MFFWYCNNNTLDDNNCSYNRWNGIYLYDVSDNNILIGNSCPSNGQDGIRITWSSNNTLVNNTFSSNGVGGITLFESNDDILRNNTMTNDGIIISGSLSGWTTHDIGTSNKVNGKPVHYYKNQSGMTVPAGAGQVILANCTDFVIENQNLSGASVGIAIEFCRNCTISNNTCNSNNYFGIFLGLSSNNTLTNNTCSGCWYGVQLSGSIDFGSNNNTLTDNNFSKNDFGIDITSASDNAMSWNRICNNSGYGIFLTSPGADRNMIWNNTFIGNNGAGSSYNPSHVQAYDSGTYNHWNVSGSPHGYGNYWSDWKTPDHIAPFGIVDNPYNISGSAGAKDYFPLALNDLDPPMTTVSLSGTLGANGWYTSSVTVSISATDNYSGVNATFYRMDTSGSWSNYSFSFVLSNDGNYTLQFYSKDNASNNEPVKSISVKIDKTNPILTINQTAGFETTATSTIISWNGSDATSNIDHFEVRIDGNTFTSVGMAMSHNFSGLADGSHNVTVKAIDGAGNEVNKTIQFTVDTGGGGGGGIDMLNLILVILVIGILVGIAIPAIFGMRRKAKESDAKAGVKDIGTSTAQMMEDTKEESGKKP
jgi:parallel beta-helix repeat protein